LPLYATPGGGLGTQILGGWRLNGVLTVLSGAPFTVNLSVDQANIGTGPSQRPDQLSNPNLSSSERSPERWFDTSVFSLPAAFSFGSAPRNSVIGPPFATLDLVIAKRWSPAGNRHVELRWEIFNALNTANFDLPNRIFGTPNFGRIFSAKDPREMQFAAKVLF
jgi:hypothetical protein